MNIQQNADRATKKGVLPKLNSRTSLIVLIVFIVLGVGIGYYFMGFGEPNSQGEQERFINSAKSKFEGKSDIQINGDAGATIISKEDFHIKIHGDDENYEMISVGDSYYEIRDQKCAKKSSEDKVAFDRSKLSIMDFSEYFYEEKEKVGGVKAYKFYVKEDDGDMSFIWFDASSKLPIRRNRQGTIERITYNSDEIEIPEGCSE